MRSYERTHGWLTFRADFTSAPTLLWIMLGECQSKCEHIAKTPLRPDTSKRLFKVYLAKGALASSAIEGNTLTEQQVLEHLEGRLVLPPSQKYLQKEVDNIIRVCNDILEKISAGVDLALDSRRIKEINARVLEGLPLPEHVKPGEIRDCSVGVGSYRGAPADDCALLLDKLCEWLGGESFRSRPGLEIATAILKAVVGHLYMAWIHPFGDGNGRTARLMEFQVLMASRVPAPAAHLLSNHYNQTRSEYYRQLGLASASGGDIMPFAMYAVQGLLDGLKSQLDLIWEQEWDIVLRNYVHELLGREPGRTATRRRHLALDLSREISPVPITRIPLISPRISQAYAKKTEKTIVRDLRVLIEKGVVEKTAQGYRVRKEIVNSFLPPQAVVNGA